MSKRSETMKAVAAQRWAEGTWKIPVWTDEMKSKRAATMRANRLGKIKLRKCGNKIYRQVMTLDGYRYEHRVVMEQLLGRKLERREHVHHINEDSLDNCPENLEILSVGDHTSHHFKGKPKAPEHRAKLSASNRLARAKRT